MTTSSPTPPAPTYVPDIQSGMTFNNEVLVPKRSYEEVKALERDIIQKFEEPEFAVINMSTKRRVPLIHKQTMIGRNSSLLLNISDISVSSKHAAIEYSDDFKKAYIVDLGAKNGVFVNEQRIDALSKKRLHHRDIMRFGGSLIKFRFVSNK